MGKTIADGKDERCHERDESVGDSYCAQLSRAAPGRGNDQPLQEILLDGILFLARLSIGGKSSRDYLRAPSYPARAR